MAALEADGLLDRAAERLPPADEMAERRRAGRGMERPELALLLAYAKRALTRDLLDSDFCDDPWLERDLRGYFPPAGRRALRPPAGRAPAAARADRHGQRQPGGQLARPDVRLPARRASAACDAADVVRAFRIAREVSGAGARWDAVEPLDARRRAKRVTELMAGVDRLVEASRAGTSTTPADGGPRGRDRRRREAPSRGSWRCCRDIGDEEWHERGARWPRGSRRAACPRRGAGARLVARARAGARRHRHRGRHAGGRSRRSRARSSCSASGCDIDWLRARSTSSRRPRARSAGRCTPCATTAWRRWSSSRSGALAPAARRRRGRGGRRLRRAPRRRWCRRLASVTRSLTRRGHERPARAHARGPPPARARRLMARARPRPAAALRRRDDATVWVETDAACEVEVLGCTASAPSRSHGHHYALVHCRGARAGVDASPYEVRLDGEQVWPRAGRAVPAERDPHAGGDAPVPDRLRLVPRVRAARAAALAVQGRAPRRPRGRRACACSPIGCAAPTRRDWPHALLLLGDQVYADEVSPGVREFIRSRRDPDGAAGGDDRRLRGVHAAVPRVLVASRTSAGCSRRCRRR